MRRTTKLLTLLATGGASVEINTTAPTITPSLSERLTNTGLEGAYEDESGGSGGTIMVAPNWDNHTMNLTGSDTMTEELTIIHGGSKSQKMIISSNGKGVKVSSASGAVGWKRYSAWIRTNAGSIRVQDDNSRIRATTTTQNTWVQLIGTGRTSAINRYILVACVAGAPATVYVDDASLCDIDFASMFSIMGDVQRKTGTFQCHPTVAANTQAGMAVAYADVNNHIQVYLHRGDGVARLSSMISGTWTENVIQGAITYIAGAELKVTVAADGTCTLYYNSIQVGSPTVVSLTTMGTQVAAWNAEAGNEVGLVQTFLA